MTLASQIVKDAGEGDELMLAAMRHSCVEICRSTMLTRQHGIIDVAGAGSGTGLVVDSARASPHHGLTARSGG